MALIFSPDSIPTQSYNVGSPVVLNLPEATGAVGDITYTLTPMPPPGLIWDMNIRQIRGVPSGISPSTRYTYTATDTGNRIVDDNGDTITDDSGDTLNSSAGEISIEFSISISPREITIHPVTFDSSVPIQKYQVGVPVDVTLPEARSAAGIARYSLDPKISHGLSFNPDTHKITGTPSEVVEGELFRYSAISTQGEIAYEDFRIFIIADPYTISNADFISLLPPNATLWEKQTEQVLIESFLPLDKNNHRYVPLIDAWNPNLTDAQLLPYLGQNLSVLVDNLLEEEAQRELLRQSYAIHKIEGTVGSLKRVIEALGYPGSAILEGIADGDGVTHWANYSIAINENIAINVGRALLRLLQDAQPVRCKLVSIDVTAANQLWDGTISFDGTHSFGSIVDAGLDV